MVAGGKGDLVTILPFTKDQAVACTMATRLSQSCGLGLLLFEELVGGGSHRCRQWNGQGEKDPGHPPLRPHWLHHVPEPAGQPGRSGRWELAFCAGAAACAASGHAPSLQRLQAADSRRGSCPAGCPAPTDPAPSGRLNRTLPSVWAWATPAWAAVEACTGMTC